MKAMNNEDQLCMCVYIPVCMCVYMNVRVCVHVCMYMQHMTYLTGKTSCGTL